MMEKYRGPIVCTLDWYPELTCHKDTDTGEVITPMSKTMHARTMEKEGEDLVATRSMSKDDREWTCVKSGSAWWKKIECTSTASGEKLYGEKLQYKPV